MRLIYATFVISLAGFFGAFGYSQLVANSRYLQLSTEALQEWAKSLPPPTDEEVSKVSNALLARARLYDDEIIRHHLVDGMVVNRNLETGYMRDYCDSLLFSSLRFVSLTKLGWADRAADAWTGIQNAHREGHWQRHPRCPKPTSRDMIVGLLAALSQEPPGFDSYLRSLIDRVDRNHGYFSTGPIYVSYLSPGLARLLGFLAPRGKLPEETLPDIIRNGYSTAELEVIVTKAGYESHLGALTVWLEMELAARLGPLSPKMSELAAAVDSMVAPFAATHLQSQRLDWVTDHLVQTDRTNLFFRYLRLRSAGALTPVVRQKLMTELLSMPQFPPSRLPSNCDRHADYVWQRDFHEPVSPQIICWEEFSGTDFLWMTALLLEGQPAGASVAH